MTQAGDPVGEVDLVGGLELVLLELVHDPERHARHFFGRQTLAVFEGNQRPIDAEHRGQAGLEMHVRRPAATGNL